MMVYKVKFQIVTEGQIEWEISYFPTKIGGVQVTPQIFKEIKKAQYPKSTIHIDSYKSIYRR